MTNSPTSLLDFIRWRVGVGELASASWSVGELTVILWVPISDDVSNSRMLARVSQNITNFNLEEVVFFSCHKHETKKTSESPWEIEPQSFRFCALMLFSTEPQRLYNERGLLRSSYDTSPAYLICICILYLYLISYCFFLLYEKM